jgi:hypothetical protein
MFIENASSAMRTPAGCYVPASFSSTTAQRTLHPAGVRPHKKLISINIASRWGAEILRDRGFP